MVQDNEVILAQGQIIARLLDELSRAAQVIASQHRIQRDHATMRRIAGEITDTYRTCSARFARNSPDQ